MLSIMAWESLLSYSISIVPTYVWPLLPKYTYVDSLFKFLPKLGHKIKVGCPIIRGAEI